MSRVYFHTPSGDTEILGSERAWLGHLADGPAKAAWDLDSSNSFDRACSIMELVVDCPDYLTTYHRQAVAQDAANRAVYEAWKPGTPMRGNTDHEPIRRFVDALKLVLHVEGLTLEVAGVRLRTANVDLNTALIAGSDPVRLAAKIHGWCESHCWVDGPDRAWFAGIIREGLRTGLYRESAGWHEVSAALESRDDEAVVLSYSVCDAFPETDEPWDVALGALKREHPWLQLTPETLADTTFSTPVSVYDLFASDRDERVIAAAGVMA